MTVFFPLDTARLRLQGEEQQSCAGVICRHDTVATSAVHLVEVIFKFVLCLCLVDEKRKAKSTPAILAEIVKEEGLWVGQNVQILTPVKCRFYMWVKSTFAHILFWILCVLQPGSLQRVVPGHLQPVLLQLCLLLLLPQPESELAKGKAVSIQHWLNHRHRCRWGALCRKR